MAGLDPLSFDRAAAFYDRTRAVTPATEAAVTRLLSGELAGRGTVVEVGVGTGRTSVPLVRAGIPVVGVDLSMAMLHALRPKLAPGESLPVARADAARLPLASRSVGAAVVCHVLHLIPDWRASVSEMVRVVRPGGVVLVDLGGHQGATRAIHRRFALEAGVSRARVGLETDEVPLLDQAMHELGARGRALPAVVEQRTFVPADLIDRIEDNEFSWTWVLDDGRRRRAADATRRWARTEFGSLRRPVGVRARIAWRAYDLD